MPQASANHTWPKNNFGLTDQPQLFINDHGRDGHVRRDRPYHVHGPEPEERRRPLSLQQEPAAEQCLVTTTNSEQVPAPRR